MAHQGGTQGDGGGRGGSPAAWGRGGSARGNELGLNRSVSGRGGGLARTTSGAARGSLALRKGRGDAPARGGGHAGTVSGNVPLAQRSAAAAGAPTPSVIMPISQGRGQPALLKGTAPVFQPGVPLGASSVSSIPPSGQPGVTATAPLPASGQLVPLPDPRMELPYEGHDLPRFPHEPWEHGKAMLDNPFWYDPVPSTITVDEIEKQKLDKKLYEAAGDKQPDCKPPPLYNEAIMQTAPYKRIERYGSVHTAHAYHHGDVICAVEHYPDFARSIPQQNDRYRTDTVFGPVFSKERKYIILQKYREHCVVIPIFTHAGRGLSAKPQAVREHYISIRDGDRPNQAPPENNHGSLQTHRYPQFEDRRDGRRVPNFHIMSDKSAAYFVYPICHSYSVPCIFESRLRTDSLDYLLHIYLDYGPNPSPAYFTHKAHRWITTAGDNIAQGV
ncbi:uncharacterized protein Bfra_012121 [Botrytis fragariae]|uniref:DUF6590 domain-containing protein n=1 Tax=Botrytis fragariae TaxID=1964551 RepID=A0A8H6AK63_9HELO|nr:uncharacterized protein Bfra_012121 [Botrytis fragariae]KAF5868790.1 hypothetical protein Bfra_012121 [Botrytis fragariae]